MLTRPSSVSLFFFFFNDTATTEIYTLSLHDALPIFAWRPQCGLHGRVRRPTQGEDRKSTRLNSSHLGISYAVFCLKKKKTRRLHKLSKEPKKNRRRIQHHSCD